MECVRLGRGRRESRRHERRARFRYWVRGMCSNRRRTAVVGARTKERGDERRVGESGRSELPRIRSAGQRGCAGEPPLPLRSEICEGTHT